MAYTKKEIQRLLASAVEEETPDVLPQILSARNQERGKVLSMTQAVQNVQNQQKKKHTIRNWAIGVAAALVLAAGLFGGYQYQSQFAVDTSVSIDVNPSIQLEVNRQEKVLSANPLNEDAQALLEGMELEGTNLKTAVNAVIGAMVQNGYLTDDTDSILLTVDNADADRGEAIQQELTQGINESLQQMSLSGSVFSQSLSSSSELEALASQYGISQGKAYWVQLLTQADSTLSADVLAQLSINDLALLAEARNLRDDANYTGTADESAYIGVERAKEIAVEKAGGGEVTSMEMDLEDGRMVYEGELWLDTTEYDFDIDAVSGEILKWEADTHSYGNGDSWYHNWDHDWDHENGHHGSYTLPEGALTSDEARALVEEKIPGAEITSFSLDWDDGRYQYEGKAYLDNVKYEFEIDAETGEFIKWESKSQGSGNGNGNGNSGTSGGSSQRMTLEEAKAVVLEKIPNATILEIELDKEDGRCYYEGEAVDGSVEYEFCMDAVTGEILEWEEDR